MIVYDESGHVYVNLSGTADISPQAEMPGAFLFSICRCERPVKHPAGTKNRNKKERHYEINEKSTGSRTGCGYGNGNGDRMRKQRWKQFR